MLKMEIDAWILSLLHNLSRKLLKLSFPFVFVVIKNMFFLTQEGNDRFPSLRVKYNEAAVTTLFPL